MGGCAFRRHGQGPTVGRLRGRAASVCITDVAGGAVVKKCVYVFPGKTQGCDPNRGTCWPRKRMRCTRATHAVRTAVVPPVNRVGGSAVIEGIRADRDGGNLHGGGGRVHDRRGDFCACQGRPGHGKR